MSEYEKLKLLHTSDWHLGATLCGRRRLDEAEAFVRWLLQLLEKEQINIVIIAGDVFDSVMPGNAAQEIYYRFLAEASALPDCRHIVVIGGNHDSPSLLEAPAALLERLNVYVTGEASEHLTDEVIEMCNRSGRVEMLVGAVPYLRDRDLRSSAEGEAFADKEQNLLNGLVNHYSIIGCELEKRRLDSGPPVVVTGHLFAAGASGNNDEGVRDLYVGGLAAFPGNAFPAFADYVALGHLHAAQKVGGSDYIRYSGSPVPVGFNECKRQKYVNVVEFESGSCKIIPHELQVFRELRTVSGNLADIEAGLTELRLKICHAWVSVDYTGDELIAGLRDKVNAMCEDAPFEVLRIRNSVAQTFHDFACQNYEDPAELNPNEVFERFLELRAIPDEQRNMLREAYSEILYEYHNAGSDGELKS